MYRYILLYVVVFPVLLFAEINITQNMDMSPEEQDSVIVEEEKVIKYFHSLTVEKNEVIRGSIHVIRGDLTVYGKILGNVNVYLGDVYLKDSSLVEGDIKTIGGKIYIEPYALVNGEMIESGLGYYRKKKKSGVRVKVDLKVKKENFRKKRIYPEQFPFPWQNEDGAVFGYNRVDGLILGTSILPKYEENSNIEFYGSIAYSFGRKKGLYQAGLEKVLISPDTNRITLGAEIHSLTETIDDWRMPRGFNSASMLFLKQDYFHYFEKMGYTAYATFNLVPFFVKISYFNDRIAPLQEKRRWSLFNQTDRYFDKMITAPDTSWMRGMMLSLKVKKEWLRKDEKTGLILFSKADFMVTSDGFSSDYSFNRLLWELQLQFLNPAKDILSLHVLIGSSENEYPEFLNFRMGGPGTIRGIRVNSLSGNRMLLMKTEWKLPFSWIDFLGLDDEKLVLFLDSGLAWKVSTDKKITEGFDRLKWNKLRTGGGFGIVLDEEDDWQIDFGFDMNHSSPRPVTYVAVSKNL